VLFTVFEMDAGPIVGQTEMKLTGDEKTTELLPTLFDQGTDLLLDLLPDVFSGAKQQDGEGCVLQDDAAATHAAKMDKTEGELWFTENAAYSHNKVRAFAGWPGTTATLVINSQEENEEKMVVKIITTRIRRAVGGAVLGVHQISMDAKANALVITCDDGSQLDVLEIQPPGKKPMDAKSFWNGMRGRRVERARVPWSPGSLPVGSIKA